MTIEIVCEHCRREYRVRDELAGKRVKCKCGGRLVIPEPAAEGDNAEGAQDAFWDEAFSAPVPEAQPQRLAYPVHEYLAEAERKQAEKEAEKLEPTGLPMLVGIFEFPWQVSSLNAWIPMTICLLVAGGMLIVFFTIGVQAGMIGVRTIGVSAAIVSVAVAAYVSACSLAVIQETAEGNLAVQEWPNALDWKEWAWGLLFMIAMFLQAGVIASVFTIWLIPWTSIPAVLVTLLVFPVVLLASSEAGALYPASPLIWRSLARRPLLWLLFYGEYIAVLVSFGGVTLLSLVILRWAALLVVAPLFAAVVLIESRLMGRLAWCIGKT